MTATKIRKSIHDTLFHLPEKHGLSPFIAGATPSGGPACLSRPAPPAPDCCHECYATGGAMVAKMCGKEW